MILVVCTGNVFRSPLAEAYLKKLLKEEGLSKVEVKSAGLYAQNGLKAVNEAIELAKEEGLDISSHLSQPLTPELLEKSKIILVMEKFHKNFIENIYPEAAGKIYLLGNFMQSKKKEDIDIKDPFGADIGTCKRVWDQIKNSVRMFVETSLDLRMLYDSEF
jgi:protein-tyrosine-phosphatase